MMSDQPDPDDVREAREALEKQLAEITPYCAEGSPNTLRNLLNLERDPRYHKEFLSRWRDRTISIIREYISPSEANKFAARQNPYEDFSKSATAMIGYADDHAAVLRALIEDIIEHAIPTYFDAGIGGRSDDESQLVRSTEKQRVFIVHGRDEATREGVARTLERLNLNVTILHEQPNRGRAIIQKFRDNADVDFAVVLLTPDDVGRLAAVDASEDRARARQNVVLELGYFLGRIGPENVCVLYQDGVEMPSDYQGVAYIPLDSDGAWKGSLVRELRAAGIDVDANLLF